jgi:hypothetical protein
MFKSQGLNCLIVSEIYGDEVDRVEKMCGFVRSVEMGCLEREFFEIEWNASMHVPPANLAIHVLCVIQSLMNLG